MGYCLSAVVHIDCKLYKKRNYKGGERGPWLMLKSPSNVVDVATSPCDASPGTRETQGKLMKEKVSCSQEKVQVMDVVVNVVLLDESFHISGFSSFWFLLPPFFEREVMKNFHMSASGQYIFGFLEWHKIYFSLNIDWQIFNLKLSGLLCYCSVCMWGFLSICFLSQTLSLGFIKFRNISQIKWNMFTHLEPLNAR